MARAEKVRQIHFSLISELIKFGFNKWLAVRIDRRSVTIGLFDLVNIGTSDLVGGLYNPMFSSEISLYLKSVKTDIFGPELDQINFGSSGSFTPERMSSYWRTKHAMIVLDNWGPIFEIAHRHAEMLKEL